MEDELYDRVLQERRDLQQKEVEREEEQQQEIAAIEEATTEKAPEDYNLGDNVKELGRALVGEVLISTTVLVHYLNTLIKDSTKLQIQRILGNTMHLG